VRWQLPGRWAGAKASDFLRRRGGHAAGADRVWPAIREGPWREPAHAPRSPGWDKRSERHEKRRRTSSDRIHLTEVATVIGRRLVHELGLDDAAMIGDAPRCA